MYGCICHRSRCACYCKHTSIDVHLRMCNGTFKHLGGAQPTARMFYIIVSTNLFSFSFPSSSSCSVQWHFMLKQWELPLWTIFSGTNYFADEWPALFEDDIFSFSTYIDVYIVWSSEQQKEHQAAFDSCNWLGQMSTFSSSYPITFALIIQYSCTYLSMSKLVRPHVHVWCYCLYRQFFFLLRLHQLSALSSQASL